LSTSKDIAQKIPELFDLLNIKKLFETPTPTQVVLLQELERFNALLVNMKQSLATLQRALLGEIGMSSDLEEMAN
jgi:dynein heavy chain, axonemal